MDKKLLLSVADEIFREKFILFYYYLFLFLLVYLNLKKIVCEFQKIKFIDHYDVSKYYVLS